MFNRPPSHFNKHDFDFQAIMEQLGTVVTNPSCAAFLAESAMEAFFCDEAEDGEEFGGDTFKRRVMEIGGGDAWQLILPKVGCVILAPNFPTFSLR